VLVAKCFLKPIEDAEWTELRAHFTSEREKYRGLVVSKKHRASSVHVEAIDLARALLR